MSRIDPDKAVAFVRESNDPALSSVAGFSTGACSRGEVIEALAVNQRDDGGWTRTDKDFQGDLSIITATFVAFQWLNWIGDRNSQVLLDTLDFLRRTQREDGSWDEPEAIVDFNPPFWMLPGRYGNQVWLTSALCCKLLESGLQHAVDFARAVDFVRGGWNGERFPDYNHTHWMALPLFHLHGSGDSTDEQIVIGCKEILCHAVEEGKGDPGDIISIAHASRLAGDVAKDLFELSLASVTGNQQEDGGWITGHGEEHRASFTVEALFLFRKIGLI